MTTLPAAAPAQPATPTPLSATALAARIAVPRRLPIRYDGQPLHHLSPSSYNRFVLCPEDWRRHYLLGERFAPSGAMFLGSRVDDTLSLYYRQLELEEQARGVNWEADLDEQRAFQIGLDALAPGLEWTVLCQLDLETLRAHGDGVAPAVVDCKVKNTPLTRAKADRDAQAGLYLAGRWLEANPAREFCFAQIAKPGPRRKQIGASLVSTSRSAGQLRGILARIAQAASQICALYDRYGPDRPWGFADPNGWKCTPRYCHHARCPGRAGL